MKPRTTPDYPISAGQRSTIKMAQHQLGISDADYRGMLKERYGVTSCTKLSYRQAGHFLQELEKKGFTIIQKPKKQQHPRPLRRRTDHGFNTTRPVSRDNDKVVCLVTPDEIDKLNKVAALIQWREENGLARFLERRMGIKKGRVKTSAEAYLAIEGLKKMFENAMKKQHGPSWWIMTFDNPAIMEYIAIHKPKSRDRGPGTRDR